MNLNLPDIAWCHVPAGEFIMGSNDGRDREKPQHTVTLPYDYGIGKYTITNRQYACFIEAGGYTEACRAYWTAAGWLAIVEAGQTEPEYWLDECYNQSNQPVVRVSWYESVAFCRWLSAVGGNSLRPSWAAAGQNCVIRLPTGAEWEKAARGPEGRIYPWGDERPTPEHANYRETEVGLPCAFGLFPHRCSPYGVEDMAGNVWEWCATKYLEKSYPYNLEDEWGEKYLSGTNVRSLRGGAFSDGTDFLRAAFRYGFGPFVRSYLRGFRVVCVPI